MEGESVYYVLLPRGLLLMAVHHVWLIAAILLRPRRIVIGLNPKSRR